MVIWQHRKDQKDTVCKPGPACRQGWVGARPFLQLLWDKPGFPSPGTLTALFPFQPLLPPADDKEDTRGRPRTGRPWV